MFGKAAMEKLASCRVAVFGVGGVGGYAVEALARGGVGTLDLIDDDRVCITNINRQLHATQKTVGRYKVEVAAERVKEINPAITVNTFQTFYTPDTASEFDFTKYDYIIDAIDTVTGKIALAVNAAAANTPIISCMGAGNKLDPTMFEISDLFKTSVCPLAKVMRTELKKRGVKKLKVVYSKEVPIVPAEEEEISCKNHCVCPEGTARKCTARRQVPASNSFVPAVAGLIAAGEVIKDLVQVTVKRKNE